MASCKINTYDQNHKVNKISQSRNIVAADKIDKIIKDRYLTHK